MKVLRIDCDFLLPDEFDGGLADALRALADYHESDNAKKLRTFLNSDAPQKDEYLSLRWNEFNKAIRDGSKVLMDFSLGEYNAKNDSWKYYEI